MYIYTHTYTPHTDVDLAKVAGVGMAAWKRNNLHCTLKQPAKQGGETLRIYVILVLNYPCTTPGFGNTFTSCQ